MFALALAMVLWGSLGAFVLWSGVSAMEVAFYRCLIGALIMGYWLFRQKQKITFNKKTSLVALAGVFLVLNWVFLFKSFQVSTITIGNISYYLQPIMLIVLGIFIYHEKVSVKKWLLILTALLGVVLTIDPNNLYAPHIVLGVFYALVAALLYTFLTVLMKSNPLNYWQVIFIQLAIGVVILLPFVHFNSVSPLGWLCLITIGCVHTLFAYFLYYQAIQKATFTQIAVLSYLDPIVAIVTDVLFFNRHLNFYQILGVVLTFAALTILVTSRSPAVEAELA